MARAKPENLTEFIRKKVADRFGVKGLVMLAIAGAVMAGWWNWSTVRDLPGISQIVAASSRGSIPLADPGRFSVAVARLENDPRREYEQLIVRLLSELEGVQVISIDRAIQVSGGIPEEALRRGRAEARRYLEQSGASVVVWGSILRLESQSRLDLNITTAAGASGDRRQYSPETGQQFSLPRLFWSDLSQVLELVIVSTSTRFQENSGRAQAGELASFIARVKRLLRSRSVQLQWSAEARARTRLILADALWDFAYETSDHAMFREAIALYEGELRNTSRAADPMRWASLQSAVGALRTSLADMSAGTTSEFERAVSALDAALEVLTPENNPEGWASTQFMRANALMGLAERERDEQRIDLAIEVYRLPLRVYNSNDHPVVWGHVQNSLGVAFVTRAVRSRDPRDYGRALECYRASLAVRSRDSRPIDWAQSQMNIGVALLKLGEMIHDRDLVRHSISAFRQALLEYKPTSLPLRWANTNDSLGNALSTLGEWDADPSLLRKAVAAFRAALEVRTREAYPRAWADTQNNIGITFQQLGWIEDDPRQFTQAVTALRHSLRVYIEVGDRHGASLAAGNLRRLIGEIRGRYAAGPGERPPGPIVLRRAMAIAHS